MFAAERGDGREAVVLLHGFGGCRAVWNGVLTDLAAGARLVVYDMPGHAASLAFGMMSPKAAARAVLDDLARRGIDRARLVGHSMGGAIAILAALADPDRVRSLTLLAPGGIGPQINGAALRRFARAKSPGEIAEALAAMSAPDAAPVETSTLEALAAMRQRDGQTTTLEALAHSISADDRQGAFPAAMLASIACPLTVAWGRSDPVLPFDQAANLPTSAKLVALDGVGHMLIEEAPETVRALIADAAR
ncbi:MAG: alpha/beta fold hydrolase [Rhizobiaceae bacterium]|nr:alpha/beta fold hydrolase [Rhizobiaceae bacterium]